MTSRSSVVHGDSGDRKQGSVTNKTKDKHRHAKRVTQVACYWGGALFKIPLHPFLRFYSFFLNLFSLIPSTLSVFSLSVFWGGVLFWNYSSLTSSLYPDLHSAMFSFLSSFSLFFFKPSYAALLSTLLPLPPFFILLVHLPLVANSYSLSPSVFPPLQKHKKY